ncbi:MAG: hypothetical protein P8186_21765, partial [Anaerolineae bacterium]
MVRKEHRRLTPVIIIDGTGIGAASISQVELIEDNPFFLSITIRFHISHILDSVFRWQQSEKVHEPVTRECHCSLPDERVEIDISDGNFVTSSAEHSRLKRNIQQTVLDVNSQITVSLELELSLSVPTTAA